MTSRYNMRGVKLFVLLAALLCVTATWATDYSVDNETDLRNAITDGANITVTANINITSGTLEIAGNKTVTIDLCGFTLNRGLTMRDYNTGGQVVTVRSGSTLNLSNGTLTGGWGGDSGGILNYGTVNLTNVIITGCTGDNRGGGIVNCDGSTFNMTGGSITGNTSKDVKVKDTDLVGGGGLFNYYGAKATLTGVTIENNKTVIYGGGGICNYGTMTLNDCTITGNHANTDGGGIWVGQNEENRKPSLNINGGTITGNTANRVGGGILNGGSYGDAKHEFLNMQGEITVTGNTAGDGMPNNLYLKYRKYVTATGSLVGSIIGITLETTPHEFTHQFSTYNSGIDPATIFKPDMGDVRTIELNSNNEARQRSSVPEGTVYYIERSWDDEKKEVVATTKYLTEQISSDASPTSETQYKVLSSTSASKFYIGTEGCELHEFYVVNSDVEVDEVVLNGPNVHIILCDNGDLALKKRITVTEGHTIYIHDQGVDAGMGRLHSISQEGSGNIGGYMSGVVTGGNIEIHGGDIDLHDHANQAAIGGDYSQTGDITIYGGKIRAEGGNGAAGIGSATYDKDYGHINIYGGTIRAIGGENADGEIETGGGAGIGGGFQCQGGNLHIYGGNITATTKSESAGIGCGQVAGIAGPGHIIIDGGTVKAYGGDYGAGIGGGDGCNGWKVEINGGHVEAYGGTDAAGIGGGEGSQGGIITITGGYVYAQGNSYGSGIGGGEDGKGGTITINTTSGNPLYVEAVGGEDCGYWAGSIGSNDSDLFGTLNIGDGVRAETYNYNISKWENLEIDNNRVKFIHERRRAVLYSCDHKDATISITDGNSHALNCNYCYTASEPHSFGSFGECSVCHLVSLSDDADNSATIAQWNNTEKSVVLTGRTLYRNGSWNTLCLPFAIDNLTGTPLNDATVKTLSSTSFADGTLTMNFSASHTNTEAGKPYIVKWAGEDNLDDITNPVFEGVTIDETTNKVETDYVDFVGSNHPVDIPGEDKTILYLGADDTLYYPNDVMTINSFRAYFLLKGIVAGDPIAGVRSFMMNWGSENTTGIEKTQNSMSNIQQKETWYDLSGRKLLGKPTTKGVYINNGSKVMIKY